MTISIRATALLAAAMLISPAFVAAQAPSDGPPSYRPGLGDLMTTTVQPRHIKLAFAGREKNWTYAAYEVHELDEAFDRLSIQWPIWQKVRNRRAGRDHHPTTTLRPWPSDQGKERSEI